MKIASRVIGCSIPLALALFLAVPPGHAAQTILVSVGSSGSQANGNSFHPAISADGRYLAFESGASNLAADDANGVQDVFVRDRLAGTTTLVSANTAGKPGNGDSYDAAISADGRFVAFSSNASDLVEGDSNNCADVFVRDLAAGTTTRASVSSNGSEGNDWSIWPSISADGSAVAFESAATNLVEGDTNGADDVFLRDLAVGTTVRVSVGVGGTQGDAWSHWPSVSADGSLVAFDSGATNLVAGDANGGADVFVRDVVAGTTALVSVDSAGAQADLGGSAPAVSADGRHVAFWSAASNLTSGDGNGMPDIFVRDRQTGVTTRLSVDSAGVEGNDGSWYPAISADGRFVAFWSQATNLAPEDTNGHTDIFVHDRQTGETARASVDSAGAQGDGDSYSPALSADGRYVAFFSGSSNLVPEDTNEAGDIFLRDRLFEEAAAADIGIIATGSPAAAVKNATTAYTFTVVNNGPATADHVTLIDVVSKGKALRPLPGHGRCRVSVHRLGTLAAGASTTVTVAIEATGKLLTQKLTAGAAQPDDVPANNTLEISTPVTR